MVLMIVNAPTGGSLVQTYSTSLIEVDEIEITSLSDYNNDDEEDDEDENEGKSKIILSKRLNKTKWSLLYVNRLQEGCTSNMMNEQKNFYVVGCKLLSNKINLARTY